jgi:NAD(P)-dependent dehydrogenase (short-subunit alcohol dehydrogenase family)
MIGAARQIAARAAADAPLAGSGTAVVGAPPAGRRAIVTGGGRGLGRAIALALAGAGADVTAVSRTAAELETLAGCRPLPCDVTDPAAVASLPDADILVVSAGTNVPEPFLDVAPGTFDHVVGLNLRAAFFTAQAVARGMVERGHGSIVFVSSQMGHVGAPNRTVYCASKHAVEGLTKALAVELAPAGVRVNAVAPTYIRTPMTAPFFADRAFEHATEAAIPLGRIGEPADVTGAVLFLCSDAARMVTGTSLVVDGGYTAQ